MSGATTFCIMVLSITNKNATLSIMTLTIMALCKMPLRITTKN